jgi:hypothetical protein
MGGQFLKCGGLAGTQEVINDIGGPVQTYETRLVKYNILARSSSEHAKHRQLPSSAAAATTSIKQRPTRSLATWQMTTCPANTSKSPRSLDDVERSALTRSR